MGHRSQARPQPFHRDDELHDSGMPRLSGEREIRGSHPDGGDRLDLRQLPHHALLALGAVEPFAGLDDWRLLDLPHRRLPARRRPPGGARALCRVGWAGRQLQHLPYRWNGCVDHECPGAREHHDDRNRLRHLPHRAVPARDGQVDGPRRHHRRVRDLPHGHDHLARCPDQSQHIHGGDELRKLPWCEPECGRQADDPHPGGHDQLLRVSRHDDLDGNKMESHPGRRRREMFNLPHRRLSAG